MHLDRLGERGFVVAGVIGHDDWRLVREARHEILPAELHRVLAEFARCDFHQALDNEGRFRPPCPAISVDRRGVGVDAVHFRVDRRDIVLARQERRVEIGRHRRREGREIGAEIGERLHPQPGDLAVGVGREFGMGDVVAAMRVGEEGLGAVGRPFDRAIDLLRRPDADRLFGIDEDLRAETAADIGRHHAQLVLRRDADEGRQHEPRDMRVLARRVEREGILALVPFADRRAGLHRIGNEAIVDEVDLRDVLRRREGRVGRGLVAEMPVVDCVVRRDIVNDGSRRLRFREIDDRRQDFVVDLDQFRRILRLRQGVGDDDGDMVAHIAHFALRKRRMRTRLHRRSVLGHDHPAADQPADAGDVVAREDIDHTRRRLRGRRVDAADIGMRMRRPQEPGMRLARTVDVIDIAALAGDEPEIFLAAHRRADPRDTHGVPPDDLIVYRNLVLRRAEGASRRMWYDGHPSRRMLRMLLRMRS